MYGYVTVQYTDASSSQHNWIYFPSDWYVFQSVNYWQKVVGVANLTLNKIPQNMIIMYVYKDYAPAAQMHVAGIQIEQKKYATPFVAGIRTGIVKDHSGNDYDATLELDTTPRWVEDAKVGSGAYEFDGFAKYIDCGNDSSLNLTNAGTISLWAKTDLLYPSSDSSYKYRGLVSKTLSGGVDGISYYIDWWGTDNSRGLKVGLGNGIITESLNFSFDWENKWRYITFTWDGSNLYLYVDGELIDQKSQTINAQILDKTVEIGRVFNYDNYNWDGYIDDVRIYNRALNADEVKQLYNLSK